MRPSIQSFACHNEFILHSEYISYGTHTQAVWGKRAHFQFIPLGIRIAFRFDIRKIAQNSQRFPLSRLCCHLKCFFSRCTESFFFGILIVIGHVVSHFPLIYHLFQHFILILCVFLILPTVFSINWFNLIESAWKFNYIKLLRIVGAWERERMKIKLMYSDVIRTHTHIHAWISNVIIMIWANDCQTEHVPYQINGK